MRRISASRVALFALLAAAGCGGRAPMPTDPGSLDTAALVVPASVASRDLFHGAGGPKWRPPPGPFRFRKVDNTGASPGFEVEDARGIHWDVKLGPEARTEVVAARLAWAVGFHQPPTHYVPEWTLLEGPSPGAQGPGRFRPEIPGWENEGTWSWSDNPFVGTRELNALYVFMALINNWDLKTAQNVVYERAGERPRYVYVVRDVGASFGHSGRIEHTKDDVAGFREEAFIRAVRGDRVELALQRGNRLPLDIHDEITVEDVRWLCSRLAALSDEQWRDAFRAGGYGDAEAGPFIARLREKVQEGLHVAARP